ncbi:MAG TPA: DNA polymerase III subunit delta [Candidatus Saccharimonadales bacterium]|nr:DNA polymerase III subunit delta [Candidatus Saccharimonadales bacterium]
MIVTITGANDLLRRRELDSLVQAFITEHTDMAVERYDGEDIGSARMRESIASMPFLTARKLVVLREPSKQKAFTEAIADVLKDVADSTDLIIYEPKLDKRSVYYKTLKKETDLREAPELDANGLTKWAIQHATEQGGTLSSSDARLLIDRVGGNQQLLHSELNKLLSYDPAITRQTIELLTEPLPQSTVFELLDAAFAGKAQRAFQLYREQRALRVEPQAILAMLAWQLHVLAVIKAGMVSKVPADQIAKEGKINPFVVRKSQAVLRNLSLAEVKQMVADLLTLDMQLKRTALDADEALQLFLLKLANR